MGVQRRRFCIEDSAAEGAASLFDLPLVSWTWPNWLPLIGGKEYTFFEYVFNVADAAISTGVGILLFFNKKIFG